MTDPARLTSFSHGAGCACKLGPAQLAEVMGGLTLPGVPAELLVGSETADDAAVYVPEGSSYAVIATTDFFTPIVDDPYDWGRIAAANAVSDIYAMGGTPAFALNLVAWPADDLPLEMLGRVLAGGASIAVEAGFAIAGGHSITDPEPKYGMVVIGFAPPADIWRNSTGVAGDRLFLTKPLGLGMISTAIKRGLVSDEQIRSAIDTMTTLNAAAAAAARDVGADAVTDVTGFGLLGHGREMAAGSGLHLTIDANAVRLLDGVVALAQADVVAGGSKRNHEFLQPFASWGSLPLAEQLVLADAQTSGGLLIATRNGDEMAVALEARGIPWAEVGVLDEEGPAGHVTVHGRLAP